MSLVRADALRIPLRDESVDLIVTSPPYFALRSYTDGGEHYDGQIGSEATPQDFLDALWAVTRECVRVLKPTGSMFVNLGDKYAGSAGWCNSEASAASSTMAGTRQQAVNPHAKPKAPQTSIRPKSLMGLPWRYAIGCVDDLDLILRSEIVWSKPNGLPESVTDRVRRSHEQWFHFTRQPRYFSAVDEVREAHAPDTLKKVAADPSPSLSEAEMGVTNGRREWRNGANPLGKLPGSVWSIPSEPLKVPEHVGVDHFAAFPQEWPRRLILGWSPPGVCVECGEGRRPVVEKKAHGRTRSGPQPRRVPGMGDVNRSEFGEQQTATITGYACSCDEPTAPTRPAVVLDPFGGTGTVAMVARALGRYPVHIDLSADYLRLARWRVYESGHAAKSRERTNREAQLGMFDVA